MNVLAALFSWAQFGSALGNHLWQSTVFAAVAALLTLLLRKNHARTRYWLWLAASLKFLVENAPQRVQHLVDEVRTCPLLGRCFAMPSGPIQGKRKRDEPRRIPADRGPEQPQHSSSADGDRDWHHGIISQIVAE